MATPLTKKFSLNDFRAARQNGTKVPFLTCYNYFTARLMSEAGVPALLVGDSAATVVLGHWTTLPARLKFMMALTRAVRRGAPLALLMGDMPFGSYQSSVAQGIKNVCRMVQLTGCDCIKLEVAHGHQKLIEALADAGVAVVAHIGLRPQTVGLLGGYKFQGRTAAEARAIVELATTMESAGAAALLVEAVPPEVGQAVVEATKVPVIGCGAGPACHGSVIVTEDALGLTPIKPRFVPALADIATPLRQAYVEYARRVEAGEYPGAEHQYEMQPDEKKEFWGGRDRI